MILTLDLQLNFKLIFIFLILTSCGVKRAPSYPENQRLPSIIERYKIENKIKEDIYKKDKVKV